MIGSVIPKVVTGHLEHQIFRSWSVSADGLGLFRLFYASVGLVVVFPFTQSLWVLDYPRSAFNPPPGLMALVAGVVYDDRAVVILHVVVALSLALLAIGWRTRVVSVVLSVCWLLVMGVGYSFGKIDHFVVIALLPLLLGWYWGGAWSLDARAGRLAPPPPAWIIAFAAWTLSVLFLTAAGAKLVKGWLDPSTAAAHGFIYDQLFSYSRDGLLVRPAAEMPWNLALEALDWGTVILEGAFVFLVLSPARFRWGLALATTFHVGVLVTMQIAFVTNIVLYALFAPLDRLARRAREAGAHVRFERRLLLNSALSLAVLMGLCITGFWLALRRPGEVFGMPVALTAPSLLILAGATVGVWVLIGRMVTYVARFRRDSGFLIFDADCGFCSRYAEWVAERMRAGSVMSWQSGQDLIDSAGLTPEDCIAASWWIDDRGPALRGQRAIAQSLIASHRHWRVLGMVLELPGISYASAVVYRLVAANRHLMPGGTAKCAIVRGDEPAKSTASPSRA